jgi:hypothetical protein
MDAQTLRPKLRRGARRRIRQQTDGQYRERLLGVIYSIGYGFRTIKMVGNDVGSSVKDTE